MYRKIWDKKNWTENFYILSSIRWVNIEKLKNKPIIDTMFLKFAKCGHLIVIEFIFV